VVSGANRATRVARTGSVQRGSTALGKGARMREDEATLSIGPAALSVHQRGAAVRVVAGGAADAADLIELLDALGLDAAEGRRADDDAGG
jgi:hypothetical protein